jgi:diaminopimelate decarboxylase
LIGLTATFGSPLQVVNGERLRRRATEALAPLRDGLGADIFYSYKTNPVPGVLATVHAAGIGAEVISEYELWLAQRLGVPADRTIYNGPAKSVASLRSAVERGVLVINANSVGDLHAIAAAATHVGRVASVGLRVALPSMWGGQFGLASTAKEVVEMIRYCRSSPSVDLVGFHVHRGHSIRSAADMTSHVAEVLAYLDDLRRRTGWVPAILDLGGSLSTATVAGIPSKQFRLNRALGTDLLPPDSQLCITVGDAARLAARLVTEHCTTVGVAIPRVVLEPGRGLTGDTQFLLTSVLDVKSDQPITYAVLDAGINIAEPTRTEFHQLLSASQPLTPSACSYRLAGPICTPADVLYNNWRLPELAPGHVLAIMDTGAYYTAFSTSFSFPRPAIVLVDGDHAVVLRRAESFDDIVRLDDLPPAADA